MWSTVDQRPAHDADPLAGLEFPDRQGDHAVAALLRANPLDLMIAHASYSVGANQITLPLRGSIVSDANPSSPPASAMASVRFWAPDHRTSGPFLASESGSVVSG